MVVIALETQPKYDDIDSQNDCLLQIIHSDAIVHFILLFCLQNYVKFLRLEYFYVIINCAIYLLIINYHIILILILILS